MSHELYLFLLLRQHGPQAERMSVLNSHQVHARPPCSIKICGAIPVVAGPVLVSCAVFQLRQKSQGSVEDDGS